jgi:glycolate oxidase iron-sulfur subunit
MRTNFSSAQLAVPQLADAEKSLRACMHCGICTATCPTYVLLGDERDSPRGRIVMMQHMLEEGGTPSAETVLHVDRCLSCLACRTACPSSVDYARLVDSARAHIQEHYSRPLSDRLLRWLIATVMTRPALVSLSIFAARVFAPIARRLPGRLKTMAETGLALDRAPSSGVRANPAASARRIALMPGCVQQVIAPEIDAAAARVLARRGFALVPLEGAGCCGSLVHHMGREREAKGWAKRAIEAFERANEADAFDAVTITATGCGAHLKDIAHLFKGDPEWEPRAKNFAAKFRDFSELASPRRSWPPERLRVAYHAACSAQNGLSLQGRPEALLKEAGFEVFAVPEGHLCCGAGGAYSILQPEIAAQLRSRKLGNIESLKADVIATGNVGCLNQLSGPDAPPVVHIAELLDWVEGGVKPKAMLRQRQMAPTAPKG